jgi:outer membrane immunogenic protein
VTKIAMRMCVLTLALIAGAAAQNHDWKGFYVGGNLGAGFGKAPVQTLPTFSPTGYFAQSSVPAIYNSSRQNVMPKGFTGGGQFGYNFQGGPWVIGFEADMGYTHLSGNRSATGTYPCCAPTTYTIAQSVKTNWLFTARPRIGVAKGGTLFYGTGGFAVVGLNYQANFSDTFATAKESGGTDQAQKGYAAGGGVEWKTDAHWSLRGEYLYIGGFTTVSTSTNLTAFGPPVIPFPTNVFTHTADFGAHLFRFGFNYHF